MSTDLIEDLPPALSTKLSDMLFPGETVFVKLKGAFKEGLVCTDRRVMVIKAGFMTGNMFGANVFQLPYRNIGSVEVRHGLMSGYFELSTGGVQNTKKSYWTNGGEGDAKQAPNSVSIAGSEMASRFKAACDWITNRIAMGDAPQSPPQPRHKVSVADEISKLAALVREGFLSNAEYEEQKRLLLSNSRSSSIGPSALPAVVNGEPDPVMDVYSAAISQALRERAVAASHAPSVRQKVVFGRRVPSGG